MTSSQHQIPWLPLANAAEKISSSTNKHHSKADVLRAGLCGMLKLSVQIVTPVFARPGHFQKYTEDAPYGVSTNVQPVAATDGISRSGFWLYDALAIQGVFAYASTGGDYVQGLLDLILIGNGMTHIENMERREEGDSEDGKYLPSGGIYLQGASRLVWEIQDEIISGEHQDPDHECEYAPAERFPGDWRIVVRTSEVERFIGEGAGSNTPPAPAPSQNETVSECQQKAMEAPEGLVNLAAAASISGEVREALLEDIASGKLEAFTFFLDSKVHHGTFPTIQPSPNNHDLDWPAGKSRSYATAIPLAIEREAPRKLQEIDVNGYEYPQMTPIKLDAVRVGLISAGQVATIKYGFLQDGRAFDVVDPPGGLLVTIDRVFVRRGDLIQQERGQQPTTDQAEAVVDQAANDFKWGWPAMCELTGLTRSQIQYRAGQLGFEIKKESPEDVNSPPGLTIRQLNKITHYKRSNAVT